MLEELKKLIDDQNLEALQSYLNLHPHLDLNHITDTGLSALWWAIVPPPNKPVSKEIIQCLMAKGVDPTQRMYNQPIYELLKDNQIAEILRQYAEHYINPTKATPQQLNDIAANGQNTHNSLIVQQFNEYIARLYQRYVITGKMNLTWDMQFEEFVKQHNPSPLLQHAIQRIKSDKNGYLIAGYEKQLSNAELLMLVWHGLNDTNPAHFVSGCSMSEADQLQRKIGLLNFLLEAQSAYGLNHPACFMGTRHKIISALDKIHIDCDKMTNKLTRERIQALYDDFCAKAIMDLQTQNPGIFASFVTSYSPTMQSIPLEVLTFISQTKEKFITTMKKEQASLPAPYQMLPATLVDQINLYLSEDMPLSVAQHQILSKLVRLLNHDAQLRKIGAIEKTEALFPDVEALKNLSAFQEWVTAHYSGDIPGIMAYLNQNPLYQQWLAQVAEPEKVAEKLWQDILKFCLLSDEINLSEPIPSTVLLPYLNSHWQAPFEEKKLLAWIKGMSTEAQVDFYQVLFTQENLDLTTLAFQYAQEHGLWVYYPLQQGVVFKNLDLRGKDFSTLNLSFCTFINCDLRLTGILKNPTLKSHHLDTSKIEIQPEKLGFVAASGLYVAAMQVFLEKYPQFIRNNNESNFSIFEVSMFHLDPKSDAGIRLRRCILERDPDFFVLRRYKGNVWLLAMSLGYMDVVDFMLAKYDIRELCKGGVLESIVLVGSMGQGTIKVVNKYLKEDDDLNLLNMYSLKTWQSIGNNKKVFDSAQLCLAFKKMRLHAKQLGSPYDKNILPVVASMKENLFAYLEATCAQEKDIAQLKFKHNLEKLLPMTSGHRQLWKPILANLLIAATGVGILVIAVHYAIKKQHFFARTRRRELFDEISNHVNQNEGLPSLG